MKYNRRNRKPTYTDRICIALEPSRRALLEEMADVQGSSVSDVLRGLMDLGLKAELAKQRT